MGFSKITTFSLTDLFVQQIEKMILSGELEIGTKLPPARELSVKMGVSRPVISAGLIELEKLGFVEIHPRQGAYVCDYRRKGTVETLVAIMRYNGGAMRQHEVVSLLQVRGSLEVLCIDLVIDHADQLNFNCMEPIMQAMADAKSPEDMAEAVFSFHHELAVLSGNVLLPLLYYSFKPEGIYLWSMAGKHYSLSEIYRDKARLYEAILNRDKARAHELIKKSIDYPMDDLHTFVS